MKRGLKTAKKTLFPDFHILWNNHPAVTGEDTYLYDDQSSSQSAARMIACLTKCGVDVVKIPGVKLWRPSAGKEEPIVTSAARLAEGLAQYSESGLGKFRKINIDSFKISLTGKRGIVFFKDNNQIAIEKYPSRHGYIDLWNGERMADFETWMRMLSTMMDHSWPGSEPFSGDFGFLNVKEIWFWQHGSYMLPHSSKSSVQKETRKQAKPENNPPSPKPEESPGRSGGGEGKIEQRRNASSSKSLVNSGATITIKSPKIIKTTTDPRVIRDYKIKIRALKSAATRGELSYSPDTSTARISKLQTAYRLRLAKRFESLYGKKPNIKNFDADHPVDLVVGGKADQQLRLINRSINRSIGSSLKKAAVKAGLSKGDLITKIIVNG